MKEHYLKAECELYICAYAPLELPREGSNPYMQVLIMILD
jgi:hypothetical protein